MDNKEKPVNESVNILNNRQKGSSFEEQAASFFVAKSYKILARNYRRKTGEIDLIVWDRRETCLVFVEVKYRKSKRKGYPEEAVTSYKQKRIIKTAEWFMQEKQVKNDIRCRFDVISILNGEICHIKNAFGGL